MRFNSAVEAIGTVFDLRRIAGAHVIDHRQLSQDELRAALVKVRPQYLHEETVRTNLDQALFRENDIQLRVLSRLILIDILLDQYDFELPFSQTEEAVMTFEQSVVNRSNEIDLVDLACANRKSPRYQNLELYQFVLTVAWENDDNKTPDEVNLLRRLRNRLGITESDHRLMEAKLGKYPKKSNELHTRAEITEARRYLQSLGLLFAIRRDDEVDTDLVPEELAAIMRNLLGLEIRTDSYHFMMNYRPLRRKAHLTEVLSKAGVEFNPTDTVDVLVKRIIGYVPPSKAIASSSPRYGLTNDQLASWCKELGEPVSGTMDDRIRRIVLHFDRLRPHVEQEADERVKWYEFYEELATRDYETLRSQHIVDRDLEIEAKFEEATEYLFAEKLNHAPLQQSGTNRPDGLLSLGSNYLMWDNKSKENSVSLRDHIRQFDGYMNQADKPVPVFIVIGPSFTGESESEAVRYHAQHFDRAISLITAGELKLLAEEWSTPENKRREEPFPLGLLATTGRFKRDRLGKLT